MKLILLMVLFSTPNNPEPHEGSRYGYGHRIAPSMEACVERRDFLRQHLAKEVGPRDRFSAFCIEFEVLGYNEALSDFKRSIGDLL